MNTYTNPSLELLQDFTPEQEVKERRTINSKTFRVSDNEFELRSGATQVHYLHEGKFEEIDLEIKDYKVTKAPYQVEIFQDRVGYKVSGAISYSMELVKCGDTEVDNKRFTTHVDGHQMFWNDVYEGVNVKIQCYPDKCETFIEVRDENAPKSYTWKITDEQNRKFVAKGGDMNKDELEMKTSQTEPINGTYFFTETWTGRISKISDPKTRIKKWFSDAVFPVVIDPTITVHITNNADNVREVVTPATIDTATIRFAKKGTFFSYDENVGLRFHPVNVPVGATINSAKIRVLKTFGVQHGKIYGDKVGNAAVWSNASRPSQITKTATNTSFAPTSPAAYFSMNITNQVASIVGLGGWASGNAMRFGMLSPVTPDVSFSISRYITSYPNKAAQLIITYTAAPSETTACECW